MLGGVLPLLEIAMPQHKQLRASWKKVQEICARQDI
jgi:hypothetical protein